MSCRITIPACIEDIYANSKCKNGVILQSMLDVGRWMFDVRQLFIRNGFMTTTLTPHLTIDVSGL
jgi:hypothetical protein